MKIEYDASKRDSNLAKHGLDFAAAQEVFEGDTLSIWDMRFDYAEERFVTIGFLAARMVVIAWTQRGEAHRIISMRKANAKEQKRYAPEFDER